MRYSATILLALGLAACAKGPKLEPAPGATRIPGGAVDDHGGVTVSVLPDQWFGVPAVNEETVPLEVTIHNQSGAPLRIRYNEFALVGPQGRRYAALPALETETVVVIPENDYFTASNFEISPNYAPLYPNLPVYTEAVHDPAYYQQYHSELRETGINATDLRHRALPEGVLNAGGSLNGFLYFQPIPEGVSRVEFRMDLINARTGADFGTVTIPFTVDHPNNLFGGEQAPVGSIAGR